MTSQSNWSPHSWRAFPVKQQPSYTDPKELQRCIAQIKKLPPLVATSEIQALKTQLRECAEGKRFLLQGGDCAEQFEECELRKIANKVKVLLQMSFVVTYGAKLPTVRIGRLAGQYSKPRSSDYETVVLASGEEQQIKSYRGDNVNSIEATKEAREADPKRLVEGYFHSAATLNCAKVVLAEGLADLRQSKLWEMSFVKNKYRKNINEKMSENILSALKFMDTVGVNLDPVLKSVDLFISHEGLHLEYEEAMTAKVDKDYFNFHYDEQHMKAPQNAEKNQQKAAPSQTAQSRKRRKLSLLEDEGLHPSSNNHRDMGYYNTGAHFIWIGDRTRGLEDAHVEYFRGIQNPIGMKVGPTMKPEELVKLLYKLDPSKEPGRITLITRFGCDNVEDMLPTLIRVVAKEGFQVVWCSDPMHGNTKSVTTTDESGVVRKFKTREFDDVLKEIEGCVKVHKEQGSFLAGVHFELTGDNVTECTGGPEDLAETDLPRRYNTFCDPRLNYSQSIEIAFRLAEHLLNR